MLPAAIDDRHLKAELFENPAFWFEISARVQALHEAIGCSRIEPRFGEMIVAGFLAQPDQFLGDSAELLVEMTEATVAAQADDGLHRPFNLEEIAEMFCPERASHGCEAGHLIELTIH